jgi:hypothetical protein
LQAKGHGIIQSDSITNPLRNEKYYLAYDKKPIRLHLIVADGTNIANPISNVIALYKLPNNDLIFLKTVQEGFLVSNTSRGTQEKIRVPNFQFTEFDDVIRGRAITVGNRIIFYGVYETKNKKKRFFSVKLDMNGTFKGIETFQLS